MVADLMELRAAVTESKEKWNEEVGEDHRWGGGQRLTPSARETSAARERTTSHGSKRPIPL